MPGALRDGSPIPPSYRKYFRKASQVVGREHWNAFLGIASPSQAKIVAKSISLRLTEYRKKAKVRRDRDIAALIKGGISPEDAEHYARVQKPRAKVKEIEYSTDFKGRVLKITRNLRTGRHKMERISQSRALRAQRALQYYNEVRSIASALEISVKDARTIIKTVHQEAERRLRAFKRTKKYKGMSPAQKRQYTRIRARRSSMANLFKALGIETPSFDRAVGGTD